MNMTRTDAAARIAVEAYTRQATGVESPDPSEALEALRVLRGNTDDSIAGWVTAGRLSGMDWDEIARALGLSEQEARQRYGR